MFKIDRCDDGQWMVRKKGHNGLGPTFLTRREAREYAREQESEPVRRFTIENSDSGLVLGAFEGEDELAAYRAMMTDAGYDDEDEQGRPMTEIPSDISVREVD